MHDAGAGCNVCLISQKSEQLSSSQVLTKETHERQAKLYTQHNRVSRTSVENLRCATLPRDEVVCVERVDCSTDEA